MEPHFLKGSAREIGRKQGQCFAYAIRHELLVTLDAGRRKWVRKMAPVWRDLMAERTPLLASELTGLAEGASLEMEEALMVGFVGIADSDLPGEGCTSLYAGEGTTLDQSLLLAQNKDTTSPLSRYRLLVLSYAEGARAISLTYPGLLCGLSLNGHGVAATGNSRYLKAPGVSGIPFGFLKRLALEKASVEEVVEGLRGVTLSDGASIVADRSGDAVLIESCSGKMAIAPLRGQAFATANSCVEKAFASQDLSAVESPSSRWRAYRGQELLNRRKGALSATAIREVLSDHERRPLSICRHPSILEKRITTACFIANLTLGEVHVAVGHPCSARFRTVQVPA